MSDEHNELRPLKALGNATAQRDATTSATDVQPKRLKALAGAVLERNRQRNRPAIERVEPRNLDATAQPDVPIDTAALGGESDSCPDPAAEARRQKVLDMLAENPGVRYAVLTDAQTDPEAVLLTLAIRGQATCELRIPRDRYDAFLLLDLIERHGGTIH